MPGGSLTSKPTWSNTFRVFCHVGFFCSWLCKTLTITAGGSRDGTQRDATPAKPEHKVRSLMRRSLDDVPERSRSRPGTNWDGAFRRRVARVLSDNPLRQTLQVQESPAWVTTADVVKGRIKEAAGALTGNDKLREEGKTDQAVGKAKQAVQKAADTVKKAVKKVIG